MQEFGLSVLPESNSDDFPFVQAKIKWNMNGNWLLTGSRDQLVKVFDIRTMKEFQTLRGHKREVQIQASSCVQTFQCTQLC